MEQQNTDPGARLTELRKKRGMTQKSLGTALNISEQAVSKWERGTTMPDIALLPAIAEILSTSIDYILTGKENVRYVTVSQYDMCRTDKRMGREKPLIPETPYNGIENPAVFPPRNLEKYDAHLPLPVPYLKKPPKIIDISVGRQLFVDDFLISETMMIRQFHKARKHPGNPIFFPETPLEKGENGHVAMAAPFSDGVWYDPTDGKTKMWYHAGWFDGTAYAESADGIHFERVDCGQGDVNRCIPKRAGVRRDGCSVVLDRYNASARPYHMFLFNRDGTLDFAEVWDSADGKLWEKSTDAGNIGDRSTIFYNPFRRKWVYSMRTGFGKLGERARSYVEADTLEDGAPLSDPIPWVRCDRLDPVYQTIGNRPTLYYLDAVAYESVILGAFEIFLGPENDVSDRTGIPKHTELQLAFSRDGFHWSRPEDRTPFISPERENPDNWERGYIQPNSGICTIHGDELWFYYTAFRGDETRTRRSTEADGCYANASMGLAKLRRDGFASMNAYGYKGTLTTRTLRFDGEILFVNGDFHSGILRAAMLEEDGSQIPGFGFDDCVGMNTDSTKCEITWRDGRNLAELSGSAVKIRFECSEGALYSFWVSDDESGRSHGCLAAGETGKDSYWDE